MDKLELPPELYRNYHQRRKSDLERLREAATNGDIEAFRTLGHQLKGNAPTYGYDDLAILGQEMEAMSETDFQEKAPLFLESLSAWITATESKLPN